MRKRLMRDVCVIGAGMTKIGIVTSTPEIKGMTYRELMAYAAAEAIGDANITTRDIEAYYASHAGGSLYIEHQIHLSNLAGLWTGLIGKAGTLVGDACAASSLAIKEATFAIASGVYDVAIVVSAEIYNARGHIKHPGYMEETRSEELLENVVHTAYDQAWEKPQMGQNSAYYAQWLIAYAKNYGLSVEEMFDTMDAIITTNYYNGYLNPKAYIRLKLEDAAKEAGFKNSKDLLRSPAHNPFVFWPIRVWDYERMADGAAAVVLCAAEKAEKLHDKPVRILGLGAAQGVPISEKMYTHPFRVKAAAQAYEMAGIKPSDVDIAEIHDTSVGQYLIASEDVGYFDRGEAWKAIIEGEARFDGDKPVNAMGGGQSGRPMGIHGAIQAYHIVKQLRGEAEAMQVSPKPKIGLAYDDGHARNAIPIIYGYGV